MTRAQPRATTQQKRANHAWTIVQQALSDSASRETFVGEVKRLGPRIITAGLGPAIAFAAAKDGKALVDRLSEWVLSKGEAAAPKRDLQQCIREGSSDQLRQWTAEALEWIVWVKRFCDADERSKPATQTEGRPQ